MLIRFGLGGQLSGSVGGVVASHNRFGAYLRNRSVPVNPNTLRQQAVRQAFSAGSVGWRDLSFTQRSAWESYAAGTPILNRLGQTVYANGHQMYIRQFAFFAGVGATPVVAAPLFPGLSTLGIISSVSLSVATGVTVVATSATADGPLMVSMGPVVVSSDRFFSGPYSRAFGAAAYSPTGAVATVVLLGGRYGPPLVGEVRPLRLSSVSADGRISDTFETIVAVVA